MQFEHAATETAPGHAALYTGALPRESGVYANETFHPVTGERVGIVYDDSTHVVFDRVAGEFPSASLAALRDDVPTLADGLRAARPDAVVLSLSLKDRGALFGGGRHPTASVWFDAKFTRFVTSSAVSPRLPGWVTARGDQPSVLASMRAPWTLLDAGWVAAHAATPDDQPGEGDVKGLGIVFPHTYDVITSPGDAFRVSPVADAALFDLALAGLDAERAVEHPTLLSLSLSTHDYVGHAFGPDSWEAWDELYRLDASLARFLSALDARWGRDGYAVLLTGDHGVTSLPEATRSPKVRPWCSGASVDRWQRPCGEAHRIRTDRLEDALRTAARDALGEPGPWVLGVADPALFLTATARALPEPRRAKLDQAVRAVLRQEPGIDPDGVIDVRTLPATCPGFEDTSPRALVCRTVVPGRSGDYYLIVRPGSVFSTSVVAPGRGTGHGSPWLFDRAVPLLARAPGRVAAGAVMEEVSSFRAFTVTAASLLGIEPPRLARGGRDLTTSPR
jgi:hypothetical protein